MGMEKLKWDAKVRNRAAKLKALQLPCEREDVLAALMKEGIEAGQYTHTHTTWGGEEGHAGHWLEPHWMMKCASMGVQVSARCGPASVRSRGRRASTVTWTSRSARNTWATPTTTNRGTPSHAPSACV